MMRIRELFEMENTFSSLQTIEMLQNCNLLSNRSVCDTCNVDMVLRERNSTKDGYAWRCVNCRTTRSVRQKSWFQDSNLSLWKIMEITYMWSIRYPPRIIKHELQIFDHTVTDWLNFCRDVCTDIIIETGEKIGGEGVEVEIDESKFGKRKYNRGRVREGVWVFGGIEKQSNKCFMVPVEDRSSATLKPLIEKYIARGSIIHSDCWKAYERLNVDDYTHLTVNHSLNFVDPDTGACTNKAEGMWSCVKRFLPAGNRSKELFSSYLGQFMWMRRHQGEDLFDAFLQDVTTFYSVN